MNNLVPPYLDDGEPVFIRLAEHSKAPKRGNSAKEGPFFRPADSELQDHIRNGGNVGRVFRDDLIAIDVDHRILDEELEDWPETLVIESGGDGLGSHWYYRVPGWNENQTELSAAGENIGSIRSGNSYCLVPPSRHDETGDKYQVSNPRNPAEISVSRLSSLIEEYSTANTGGGGGGGDRGGSAAPAPGVGGADAPIPEEYPNRDVTWKTMRSWLQANGFLSELNRSSGDRSGREFKLAKCLAEGGFSNTSISEALDRLPHDSKWHEEGQNYRQLTVQKAIESAVNDSHVDFSNPVDMEAEASERRKTEESGEGRTLRGGDNMSSNDFDYTSKKSLTVYNADSPEKAEDGERVVRAELTNMKGRDENGEVDTDFVTISKGTLRDNGEFGVSPEFPQDSKSVGSANPDDLRLIAEALEQLADDLDD